MAIMSKIKCLILNPNDNVGVLTASDGKPNQLVEIFGLSSKVKLGLRTLVPKGHKIAIKKIKANEPIIKFGQAIGLSNRFIMPGEHVHIHNIRFSDKIRFSQEYLNEYKTSFPKRNTASNSFFQGYLRKDGRAGTRNYIVVIATVNCSATVVKEVARHFEKTKLSKFKIDGIIPVTHNSGCAQALGGYSNKLLNKTILGWLCHHNVVGAVVIGLGCEDISIDSIISNLEPKNRLTKPLLESFNIQDAGGTKKAINLGIKKVNRVLSKLPVFNRIKLPVSLLTVALNCGGSDAFSAITANPALGISGDILVSNGGTIVLGETPECFGAEKYLIKRCALKKDKKELEHIFSWWLDLTKKHNITLNNNLAPGNIAGGISTILEKSLGAVSKGGTSPIRQVVDYAEQITKKGLIFMNTPGFDPVSVTGLVSGGCNLVAFTTGRGSMYGCSIAPTIKISTDSKLYKKLHCNIDIDAGKSLTGSSLAEVGQEIYDFFIQVASGALTCSEKEGLGKEEFVPWQLGETL